MDAALLSVLARELGPGFTIAPEALTKVVSDDSTIPGRPEAVFFPKNAPEISRLLHLAGEYGFPVVPRGAGTGLSGGSVASDGGVVLATTVMAVLFSVITPSCGRRPRALALAGRSVEVSVRQAGLASEQVEWLVGFDGVAGECPETSLPTRCVTFPQSGDFGNRIRNGLLRVAKGRHLLFLDDDNAYTPEALSLFAAHPDTEMCIGRVDVHLAFDGSVLPQPGESVKTVVRQGNIDPLCLCLSRELVAVRCGGWQSEGGYESDLKNILRYFRRARSM